MQVECKLKDLLETQQESLNYFFNYLELTQLELLIDAIKECSGVVFFSGVGKSGFVAEKIAATLTSTGTRSLFLSPTDALHGDIGMVHSDDLVVFLSKSGQSDELLQMIPSLKHRQVQLYAVTTNSNNRLAHACDYTIELPLDRELCPFGLAPTNSTIIQMLFGDLLTVALMEMRQFTLEQYILNHPAGSIGKRITLRVCDLMLQGQQIPLCNSSHKLFELLVELSDKRCGCLLVVDDEKKLQGIFTDGDLRRALQKLGSSALERPIDQLMTKWPKWTQADALASHALALMEKDKQRPITALPVLDSNQSVVGLIRLHDILQSGL